MRRKYKVIKTQCNKSFFQYLSLPFFSHCAFSFFSNPKDQTVETINYGCVILQWVKQTPLTIPNTCTPHYLLFYVVFTWYLVTHCGSRFNGVLQLKASFSLTFFEMTGEESRQQLDLFLHSGWYVSSLGKTKTHETRSGQLKQTAQVFVTFVRHFVVLKIGTRGTNNGAFYWY